jgi:hypothetical protein
MQFDKSSSLCSAVRRRGSLLRARSSQEIYQPSDSSIVRHQTIGQQGLDDAGDMEGQNVALAYRSAEYRYERLPEMVLDLVRHGRPPFGRKEAVCTKRS